MINSQKKFEKFLQIQRFKHVIDHLEGDVMDFGGNKGELREYVKGSYTLVDYDHTPMEGKYFDTIVCLAVIEHIEVKDVFEIFRKFKEKLKTGGKIFITTPTRASKPVLEFLAFVGILDKENIKEHKHYWSRKDIDELARVCGFSIKEYKKFQFGFNQFAVLVHQ